MLAVLFLVGCKCGVDAPDATKPSEFQQVKVLKVYPQRFGVLVSIETATGKRDSITIGTSGPIPQDGETWLILPSQSQGNRFIEKVK